MLRLSSISLAWLEIGMLHLIIIIITPMQIHLHVGPVHLHVHSKLAWFKMTMGWLSYMGDAGALHG